MATAMEMMRMMLAWEVDDSRGAFFYIVMRHDRGS